MQVPKGFEVENSNSKDYVLKLHHNFYGQKQVGQVWNQYLVEKLTKQLGFQQSKVDECVFYHGNVPYVLYTDNLILAGPDLKEIERAIDDIRSAKLDITVKGDLQHFLGVTSTGSETGQFI